METSHFTGPAPASAMPHSMYIRKSTYWEVKMIKITKCYELFYVGAKAADSRVYAIFAPTSGNIDWPAAENGS